MKDKKIPKNFRLSDLTIRRLEAISKRENRNSTESLEFMIQEKADYYGIKMLRKKDSSSGAFPYGGGSDIPLVPQNVEVIIPVKKIFKRRIKNEDQTNKRN